MTTYYTVTGNPVSLSRGASSTIRNEYTLIQTGFATVNTEMTGKGAIAGQVWTGAHDFSGATSVLVPTPLTATAAATKAYVDALSVAAGNVPLGGSAGQYLKKNSATNYDMSWGSIADPQGSGGRTVTGNLTLTVTSGVIADAAISVTPTAPGLYVTLPVATTITTEGVTQISVYNAGDYDYGVKDSAGTQLGWVRPRTGAIIGLADNSTAAGVWASYGLEKTGITAAYANSTITAVAEVLRRVTLDANRTLFLFGGTTCYAIVYDASTQTWGTATSVRTGLSSGAFNGVLSTTNQVLVCSCDATTGLEAVTLTLSGTGVTVNTGTKAAVVLAGNFTANQLGQLIANGTSWVLSYARATTTGALRAITVSGTTPTIGAESAVTTAVAVAPTIFSTGAVVRALAPTTSATTLSAIPYTVATSTLTLGTAATATITNNSFRAFVNGNGNIVCQYINTTHFATIFKLTGTVEAASSVTLGTVPTTLLTLSDYVAVTASKTLFAAGDGTSSKYFNILTDTSGTATAGTQLTIASQRTTVTVAGLNLSGSIARVGSYGQAGGVFEYLVYSIDCSGTSPAFSSTSRTIAQSTTGLLPRFEASNLYGQKSNILLIAGQSTYTLPTDERAYQLVTNGPNIGAKPQLFLSFQTTTFGASGSSNESVVGSVLDGSTVGITLQRVEAAA